MEITEYHRHCALSIIIMKAERHEEVDGHGGPEKQNTFPNVFCELASSSVSEA
jgi:hypothetical protein